jgi:hypothetical protein
MGKDIPNKVSSNSQKQSQSKKIETVSTSLKEKNNSASTPTKKGFGNYK